MDADTDHHPHGDMDADTHCHPHAKRYTHVSNRDAYAYQHVHANEHSRLGAGLHADAHPGAAHAYTNLHPLLAFRPAHGYANARGSDGNAHTSTAATAAGDPRTDDAGAAHLRAGSGDRGLATQPKVSANEGMTSALQAGRSHKTSAPAA